MKRVLSLGDIAFDESENVDGENGVFTQVKTLRANRSKKTKNPTTVSDQSKDTSSTILSAVNPQLTVSTVSSEDQVNKLFAIISEQNLQIQKLDFVLSFLGINDASLVTTNDSTSSTVATASTAATAAAAAAATYAGVSSAAVNTAASVQTARSRPVNFHEAVVTAVHTDQRARERRAVSCSFRIETDTSSSDAATFHRLCVSELGIDAEVTYIRQLGNVIDGRIQPLLV